MDEDVYDTEHVREPVWEMGEEEVYTNITKGPVYPGDIVRYGNLRRTTFDAVVSKRGSSYVVTISKVMEMMGLVPGDLVRVTLQRLPMTEEEQRSER